MTEKTKTRIDDLVNILPDEDKMIYRDVAEHAAKLGYSPSKIKDTHEPVIFAKNVKNYGYRRLCKISPPNLASGEGQQTNLALSFYAVSDFSQIFHESVRKECESRKEINVVSDYSEVFRHENVKSKCNFRKESCDKCRKCKDYYYTYPCGKIISCCHTYLIELPPISAEHVDEIKSMMKAQHECWTHHLNSEKG